MTLQPPSITYELIEQQIANWLVDSKSIERSQIHASDHWIDYDIDSITSAQLLGHLEGYMQMELDLMLLKDYPTIGELATHLATLSPEVVNPMKTEKNYGKYVKNRTEKV